MSIPTPTLVFMLIVVLLPDWLSSAELQPSPVNQLDPQFFDDYTYEDVSNESPLSEAERTGALSWRQKRLMGIFRCNGWGPGCTQLEGASDGGEGGGGRGRGGDARQYRGGEAGSLRSPIEKFQPFFTLTSGGSWGPTGKRSSTQLHSSRAASRTRARKPGPRNSGSTNLMDYVTRSRKRSEDLGVSRETQLLHILSRLLSNSDLYSS